MNMRSTKKKILHILWSGEIGGTEEYIITLLKHFDYSTYEIYLCVLSRKGLVFEEASKLKDVNVAFIGIKNGFDILGGLKFTFYLYREKFNIIHSHMRNFMSTAILSLFTIGVPKILTHHVGPVDVRFFKKEKAFYKLFSGFFNKIIAISNTVKENLINDLHIKHPDRIQVIYNCIDLNKFDNSCTIPSDLSNIQKPYRYIFGFIGRMEYFKRPSLFIEIASELIKKDGNLYFVMVGDGPELEECKNMIHQYRIGGYFKLLGFRRDIPNVLRLFDALLFTSMGEGFGIVLLEAMAMGVPVFAINDGAVPEIISHKDNGILLNTSDPKLIAQQILEFIEDKQIMAEIKKKCIEDVRTKFSVEVCVNKIENVYKKVMYDAER